MIKIYTLGSQNKFQNKVGVECVKTFLHIKPTIYIMHSKDLKQLSGHIQTNKANAYATYNNLSMALYQNRAIFQSDQLKK